MPLRRHIRSLLLASTMAAVPAHGGGLSPRSVWVLVDTPSASLVVYRNHRPVERFDRIAIGRRGAADSRRRGDGTTPTGWFRVAWVNPSSKFRRFFGIDFPNMDHADAAYRDDVIERRHWLAIKRALEAGRPPPSNTPLGGSIGIHGLGAADPKVHALYDWTQGCIAVTNQQLDRLGRWLKPGTPVLIR